MGRCSVATIQSYYVKWSYNDKVLVTAYQHLLNGKATEADWGIMGSAKGIKDLASAQAQYNADYINWSYCQGYTDAEITTSQVNLQVAQANLAAAQATLAKLQANNGIDPDTLALDQATVKANTLSAARRPRTNWPGRR